MAFLAPSQSADAALCTSLSLSILGPPFLVAFAAEGFLLPRHTLLVYACACGHPYHSYHPHFFPHGLPLRCSLIPLMFRSAALADSCSSCVRWRCPHLGVGGFLSCRWPIERGRRVVFMSFVRSAGALVWWRCALRSFSPSLALPSLCRLRQRAQARAPSPYLACVC